MRSAHVDTFTRDHLPPPEQWPDYLLTRPEFGYPEQLNAATQLLDRHILEGNGDRRCVLGEREVWSYADLHTRANKIAHVLVDDLGVKPGNRVLLRGPNNPMLAACWFAVMKAGAVAVATMPLYKENELRHMIDKAQIDVALCDERLLAELTAASAGRPGFAIVAFQSPGKRGLECLMDNKPASFVTVDTAADDIALIAFTSGTTGKAKGTMHMHRDIMAACDAFPRSVLRASAQDLFCGSPPLAFTFGLGGLLLFPLRVGAATLLLEKATPELLLEAIQRAGVTVIFTAPIAYRAMTGMLERFDIRSLRTCVSAGETLPLPIWQDWYDATGLKIIDGIGGTEMLHIYIASPQESIRPGSTGQVVPGYEARIVDDAGNEVAPGTIGRLCVRGPTGCKYLDDDRQTAYVQKGWNFPGDAYRMDADGYFWYVARTDDMIVAAGYNISGPEVEEALLGHPDVKECAVVAAPDPQRQTQMVKAFVVLRPQSQPTAQTASELQEFVKSKIATFKAPRSIEFVETLPRTETGKVQRFVLRNRERNKGEDPQ